MNDANPPTDPPTVGRKVSREPTPPHLPSRVIVSGYGPVGRFVTDYLEDSGVAVHLIELNLRTVEQQLSLGRPVTYGDVRDPQTLHRAGVAEADALVLAIPDENVAVEACRVARETAPHLFIAARTNFMSKGMLASAAGADHVTVEEVVTAEAMQRALMERLLGSRAGDGSESDKGSPPNE